MSDVHGIHHVTGICGDAQANVDFYAGILGMRLVKKTVNFDDPTAYHLYYGDALGHPGTILTFFPYPSGRQGQVGTGQATSVALAVPKDSLDFWGARLVAKGVKAEASVRFGEHRLGFHDHDGLNVEIVGAANGQTKPWATSEIPVEHAIMGIHSCTITVEGFEETAKILHDRISFRAGAHEGNLHRYTRPNLAIGAVMEVLCAPYAPRGHSGVGSLHHIAFRVDNDHKHRMTRMQLMDQRFNVSPQMDRNYFHSIYFREPGGVLFEVATDLPGFATDETVEELGTKLCLPAWMEPRRAAIEAALEPLVVPA